MQAKVFRVETFYYHDEVGRPSREIAVPTDATLHDLADAILKSFNFDNDHLFGFYNNVKKWTRSKTRYELSSDGPYGEDCPGVKHTLVSEAFPARKRRMLFLFDYSRDWRFVVQYLDVIELPDDHPLPSVLASIGDAPFQYENMRDWEDYFDDGEDEDENAEEEGDDEAESQNLLLKNQERTQT
ncbi:hypothetical protein FHS18_003543 [Paenibacillus phyllosphaerae]|uniref:Plasmid pRiA4b Orf3-like domain-containing protein n=1 Tax=Paenibacillus phyllosphaerae TaxID=274593 RepID=A0A7W5FNM6_9BACL|nr:hypothetical protein [Paenibacillus phyllosphaerae]MBB3111475.1 hypothetical protein [Paenibacillus phyllosphaerae]